jgi:hypothetical protein
MSAAVLTHLSEEELLLLLDVIEKLESSPVPPLSEPESQAVEAYYKALEFESRQARLIYTGPKIRRSESNRLTQNQNRTNLNRA